MNKKILPIIGGIAVLAVIAVTSSLLLWNNDHKSDGSKLNVVTSFNAMTEFSKAVGGDKVDVTTIIPDGAEPHEFEPKANDLVSLSQADVFVYNGLGMESWAEEAVQSANNSKLVSVEAAKDVNTIKLTDEEIEEHEATHEDDDTANADVDEHEQGDEQDHEHGEFDPHTWLSLENAVLEVNTIKDAFVQADQKNASTYEQNAKGYVAKLQQLFNDYKGKFASAKSKAFVTGHAAFGYLARDFGLTQNSVEGIFAEGEPSPSELSELVDYCKEHNVKTIFAEEMVAPDVSATLASEVGANVQTIYTIESNEDDLSYLDRIKSNLEKIYNSLNA
jgi:zinc transport system substrate-binding protein